MIKLKSVYPTKERINRVKRQLIYRMGENVANYIFENGLDFKKI